MKRTKTISYDKNNYQKTPITTRLYKDSNTKIRSSKVVTTPKKVKTVTYGPINSYGKQTKVKTIAKKK